MVVGLEPKAAGLHADGSGSLNQAPTVRRTPWRY